MKHTRGPWKVELRNTPGEFVTTTHIVSKDGSHIAIVAPCDIKANASLIAAAPELLDAYQNLWKETEDGTIGRNFFELRETFRSIMEKIKGE